MFNFIRQLSSKRHPRWRSVRAKHLQKQRACQFCGRTDKLEVHHIIPVSVSPDLELVEHNLVTLCSDNCHFIVGHFRNWRTYNPDVVKSCEDFQNTRAVWDNMPKKTSQRIGWDWFAWVLMYCLMWTLLLIVGVWCNLELFAYFVH